MPSTTIHYPKNASLNFLWPNATSRNCSYANEVWLLYSSDAEGMGKGEPSRFILQIKNELAVKHPNINVVEEVLSASTRPETSSHSLSIHKDERTMLRLKEMAIGNKEKNIFLSPTSINRYRKCPQQFFYSDVLGVREQKEVSEDLEANELGHFVFFYYCYYLFSILFFTKHRSKPL